MRNILILVGALVVSLGLAWLLLGDGGLFSTGPEVTRSDEGDPEGGTRVDGASRDGTTTTGRREAVLFGRPRSQRVGRGWVAGRLQHTDSGEAVTGAQVLLAGTGYGDEEVAQRLESGEDGSFRFNDVPAGDDYALQVEAEGLPGRTMPGILVRDGTETTVGVVWLGAKIALEGGVVDARGVGVVGAEVRVYAGHFSFLDMVGNVAELFSNLDRDPEPLARTETRGQGWFEFEALDPGPVTLGVRAPGHEPAYLPVVVAEGASGERLTIRLRDGLVVAGVVVDLQGRGIEGAKIAAISGDSPLAFLYGRSFTHTESDGSFRLDTAGSNEEVQLLATAPGHPLTMQKAEPGDEDVRIVMGRSATLVVTVLESGTDAPVEGAHVLLGVSDSGDLVGNDPQSVASGVTGPRGSVTFNVRPGTIQMVWVTQPAGPSGMWSGASQLTTIPGLMEGPEDATIPEGRREVVFRLAASLVVSGTVEGPDGEPVVGARVMGLGGIQFGRPAYTDETGRYTLTTGRGQVSILFVVANGYVAANEMLEVAEGASSVTHDVTLETAGVVTGRVVDEKGGPVSGARVRAHGAMNPMMMVPLVEPSTGMTGKDGRYVLDSVPPGENVRIMVRHPAYVDGVSEPLAVTSGGTARAEKVVMSKGTTLEVTVRGPRGAPFANARVELSYARDANVEWDFMDMWQGDAILRSDARGKVTQNRVPPSTVTISASHPDHAMGQTVIEVKQDAASPVRAEVSLLEAMVIAGRVVDQDGRPIKGAFVNAQVAGGLPDDPMAGPEPVSGFGRTDTTDAEGKFRIERLARGTVELQVSAAGFSRQTSSVTGPSETVEVRLVAMDPRVEERRREIQARLMELYQQIGTAANDAERQALAKEMTALQMELQSLQGDDAMGPVPPPPPPEPIEIEAREIEEED